MESFQILDNTGKAIEINTLDKEICEILGVEYDEKNYCKFKKREECVNNHEFETSENWYDIFGYLIAKGVFTSTEDIVKYYNKLFKDYIGLVDKNNNTITLECIIPNRMKIVKHWKDSGYTLTKCS